MKSGSPSPRLADKTWGFPELHRWILYRGLSSYRVILALVKPERKFPRQAQCGCGAVVAHHLAKVRVASSNLVIRSSVTQSGGRHLIEFARVSTHNTVTWPRGEAAACKAVHTGSNPVVTSQWAIGAAVARFPDTEEVTGSIPVSPTRKAPGSPGAFCLPGMTPTCARSAPFEPLHVWHAFPHEPCTSTHHDRCVQRTVRRPRYGRSGSVFVSPPRRAHRSHRPGVSPRTTTCRPSRWCAPVAH